MIVVVGIFLEEVEELCVIIGEGLVEIGGINLLSFIMIVGDRDKVYVIFDELCLCDLVFLVCFIKMNYVLYMFYVDVFKDEFFDSVKYIEI